jgi:hypothetical protein
MTTDFAPVDPSDASLPGTSMADAWMAVLVEARDGGWLPSLVARITEARPDDATLREAASLLAPRRSSPELRAAGLLFVAGAASLGALAAGGVVVGALLVAAEAVQELSEPVNIDAASVAFQADDGPSASLPIDPAQGKVVSVARPTEGLSLVGDGSLDAEAQDAAPADPDGDPQAVSAGHQGEDGPPDGIPEPGVVALVPHAGPHTKCGGHPGEAVGYWYAGRHSPTQGETVVLDHMVNVRADYPRRANHWSTRSRVRCVLEPGDLAHISSAPITVEGGHVWVPVLAGDVRAASSDGTAMADGE